VRVFLLNAESDEKVFYAEEPVVESEIDPSDTKDGVLAWADRYYNRIRKTVTEAESGVNLRLRRAWEWVQRRTGPDEPVLRSLRHSTHFELLFPSALSPDEASNIWANYLSRRFRYHLVWFLLDALISPFTVLLAPLPGPNIIGYWFAYRAICHMLALLGIRKARRGLQSMTMTPEPLLDRSFSRASTREVREITARYGLTRLEEYLEARSKFRGVGAADTSFEPS
jgi:hypothetical protein